MSSIFSWLEIKVDFVCNKVKEIKTTKSYVIGRTEIVWKEECWVLVVKLSSLLLALQRHQPTAASRELSCTLQPW